MSEVSFITRKHHRRPPTLDEDGAERPANISYVKEQDHKDYHTIFGNMNAFQTCDVLNKLRYKPENMILVCEFINGSEVKKSGNHNSKNKRKIDAAWKRLFGKYDFAQAVAYINSTWLDPSYHIKIKTLQL